MTHKEFRLKLPKDPENIFWTHLQLLKECKFVSVIHNIPELEQPADDTDLRVNKEQKIMRKHETSFHGRSYCTIEFFSFIYHLFCLFV